VSGGEKVFVFLFCFCFFLQALEAAKSGLVLFYEAMEEFNRNRLAQSFELFERAAAKGHERIHLDPERREKRGDEEECFDRGLCQDGGAAGVVLCGKAFRWKGGI
jgi:hypothetical protein